MLFRVMNHHQRCLQAKVKKRNDPKQVKPKSQDYMKVQGFKLENILSKTGCQFLGDITLAKFLSTSLKSLFRYSKIGCRARNKSRTVVQVTGRLR